jgi:hypothetical protein
MRRFLTNALFILSAVGMAGCNSTEKKQINACVDSIKSGLNDPGSFELVSTKPVKLNDGAFRIVVEFTAKNALGGRIRKEEICGFASEKDTTLSSSDFMNQERDIKRSLGSIGIKVR